MLSQGTRSKMSAILVALLLLSILIPTTAMGAETSAAFKDITDSYAQKEIQSLVDDQVINGYEDGSFQPEKAMTRAELAKILVLTMGLQQHADQASGFADVDSSSWYAGYVGALVQSGITQGTSATTFSPNANVTREELVLFFIRAMGLESSAQAVGAAVKLSDFQDVSSWAQPAVSLAFQIGFINGIENSDGSLAFNPKDVAQRQALARLAYEFKTNKTAYITKANALLHSDEPAIISIKSVSSTSMEVTFAKEVTDVQSEDFTFDPVLLVTDASLQKGSTTVVVLTTKNQTSGTTYRLTYKGKDTGITVIGTSSSFGGGGGGGGVGAAVPAPTIETDLDKINKGGTYDSLTVTTSGTVGPADDQPKTIVTGTLLLNPGENGEILLQNVEANNIVVTSGSSNSIKLKNTIIKTLRVAAPNQTNPVRIETLSGSDVTDLDVQSKVIIESTAGTLGMIKIGSAASGQVVELRGTLKGDIQIDGEDTQIKIAPPKDGGTTAITNLNVGTNATIISAAGTTLQHVNVSAKSEITLTGEGNITSFTVSAAAQGSTLNIPHAGGKIAEIQLDGNVNLQGDADTIGSIKLTAKPGVVVGVSPSITDTLKNKAISAIAAIGAFSEYSKDVEAKVDAAAIVADNAILLGVSSEELTGYTTTLAEAKQQINRLALDAAARDLQLHFAQKDSSDSVTQNIELPVSDASRGVSISWKSSNSSIVSNDGVVTRPAIGSANETVVLTATFSKNQATRDAQFVITVVAQLAPDNPDNGNSEPVAQTATPTYDGIVYPNSVKLTGTAEPSDPSKDDGYWNTVTLSKQDGTYVTSNYVAPDGSFSLMSKVSLAVGDKLLLTAQGHGKKSSDAVILIVQPTQGVTPKPTVTSVVYEVNSLLSGIADPGAFVTFSYGEGEGDTTTTDDDGYYRLYLWNMIQQAGGQVTVTATVHGKATSEPVMVTVQASVKTDMPTVTGAVYTNSAMLSGRVDPGLYYDWSSAILRKQDGTIIAKTFVNEDGSYLMETNIFPVLLEAGEQVYLTTQSYGKRESDPVPLLVRATNGQTEQPSVIGAVYDASYMMRGYAEPGALVKISSGIYGQTSNTRANSDGTFECYMGYSQAGTIFKITATAIGKADSEPLYVTAQAAPQTATPTVTGDVFTNGVVIAGKVDLGTGDFVDTRIDLKKKDGTYVASSSIAQDGTFSIQSDVLPNRYQGALVAGEELFLTAQTMDKNVSNPAILIVKPTQGRTASVMTDVVNETLISGWAEFGATVIIKSASDSSGNMRTVASTTDGFFTFYPDAKDSNDIHIGDQLSLTATVIGEDTSEPKEVTVGAAVRTETPTVTGDVYSNFIRISGNTEPGMWNKWTSVYLKKLDGTYVRYFSVDPNGTFSSNDLVENQFANLTAGEELQLTSKAYGKKESEPVTLIVQATDGQTASPTVTEPATEAAISGWAEPGSIVSFQVVRTGFSEWNYPSYDGSFSFAMFPIDYVHAGDQIKLTATTFGKATSDPVYVTVIAAPQTAAPTVTGAVYTNGFHLQGSVGSASNYYNLILANKYNANIGSFGAGSDGYFSGSQLFQSYVHLNVGDVVQLRAQANGMSWSEPVPLVVQAPNGQTEVPTIIDDMDTNYFTGIAEPGAIIALSNDTTGFVQTTTASTGGGYYIYRSDNAYRIGDQLSLTATVLGKETSDTVQITLIAAP